MNQSSARSSVLPRSFYRRPATSVAPDLLSKILVVRREGSVRSGRIVEVEAYGGSGDAASHAAAGRTKRNATMFGPPGFLYVYFTYGMHWCANAVCEGEGYGAAVLIRALSPLRGLDGMRRSRAAAKKDRDLCSGPAKLTQALGFAGDADGLDLCGVEAGGSAARKGSLSPTDSTSRAPLVVSIEDDGAAAGEISTSPRIGISKATAREWRWFVNGDPNVSRARFVP